jgi:hypothetical protein
VAQFTRRSFRQASSVSFKAVPPALQKQDVQGIPGMKRLQFYRFTDYAE